jgi:hypothetical protein
MSLRSIGASMMHLSKRFAASAMGGFKIINGPSTKDKGPMSSKEDLEPSNETSPSRPTQAGRIELCQEAIKEARKCLSNGDKECVMRLIEELIKANCHDGRLIGKEIADGVREVVRELWLVSNHEEECRLLRILRDLGVSRSWVRIVTRITNPRQFNERLERCGISWKSRATRNDVVKRIEDLLRRLGWGEAWMCEELFRFIGVDVEAFRRHGIEPCVWLNDLEKLGDLKKPYWFGLRTSDLSVKEFGDIISLEIDTTGSVDAVFFPTLLNTVKTPSLIVKRERGAPAVKYVQKQIVLTFYVDLGVNKWPWPMKLSDDEFERILNGFSDEELSEFLAGEIDGDGSVVYYYNDETELVFVYITACKACPKRIVLDVLKEIIAKRFGIIGTINQLENADALVFRGRNAVKLLRHITRYLHHPLKRLRAELILAYYDGRISREELMELYKPTEYEQGKNDIKRNRGLETLARAAPQTHTHGATWDKENLIR